MFFVDPVGLADELVVRHRILVDSNDRYSCIGIRHDIAACSPRHPCVCNSLVVPPGSWNQRQIALAVVVEIVLTIVVGYIQGMDIPVLVGTFHLKHTVWTTGAGDQSIGRGCYQRIVLVYHETTKFDSNRSGIPVSVP